MGRSKKYHKYTAEQLTELAKLTTRKQLNRFSRLTKHPYLSVYNYWRKLTGKKLTDVDPKVKRGAPRKVKDVTPVTKKADTVNTESSFSVDTNAISVPIKSLQIVNAADGTQKLVITY